MHFFLFYILINIMPCVSNVTLRHFVFLIIAILLSQCIVLFSSDMKTNQGVCNKLQPSATPAQHLLWHQNNFIYISAHPAKSQSCILHLYWSDSKKNYVCGPTNGATMERIRPLQWVAISSANNNSWHRSSNRQRAVKQGLSCSATVGPSALGPPAELMVELRYPPLPSLSDITIVILCHGDALTTTGGAIKAPSENHWRKKGG